MLTFKLTKTTFIASLLSFLTACGGPSTEITGDTALPNTNFNWDVRPILSDNCFACHGPDAEGGQKAGLRLDLFETATAELPESAGKFAIVPGDLENSELIRRITSDDPDIVMPPPSTNKHLSEEDTATLMTWIEDGAEYQPHWAYVSPEKVDPGANSFENIIENEIDTYIFARLEQENLTPSPVADRATLINRVSLDLTGLPPSLEALDAFVNNDDADAYENLVDDLLASTAHAEHMTSKWLDIARYADTDGYLGDDGARLLYPWRDWVISAYEDNMPFDEFSSWQLAGDLLPNPSREQLQATTFLRLGQRSTENGLIEEEYLAEYAIDRVETVGVGFLGHTVGCARCHDHKYDPISIKDFYSFSAFFTQLMEPGFYAPGGAAPYGSHTEVGPTLILANDVTLAAIDSLSTDIEETEAEYEALRADTRSAIDNDLTDLQITQRLEQAISSATVAYYPLDEAYEGSLDFARILPPVIPDGPMALPAGLLEDLLLISDSEVPDQEPAVLQAPLFGEGVQGEAFYFDGNNKGFLGGGVGAYDRTDSFSFDLWIKPADVYEDATIVNHMYHDRFASTGYTLDFINNVLRFDMIHTRPGNMISVQTTEALAVDEWAHITVTYDGSSKANGIQLYLNGDALELDVIVDRLSQSSLPERRGWIDDAMYGFAFGKRWQQYTIPGSALDEIRLFDRDLSALEVNFMHNGEALNASPEMLSDFLLETDGEVLAEKALLTQIREEHNLLLTSQEEIMIMGDDPNEKPAYVLQRGVYSDPGERVYAQAYDQIYPWDESLPRNRLGLTQWLFDSQNPLTARVTMNRVWQQFFGRGLVETTEDFGTQGSVPSHPELLDWLAVEFMESGWDTRHMLRLLTLSTTYKQDSSVSDALMEADPYNMLLSRGVRQRFPAEIIRDNALLAGGLLDLEVGGASVFPYQPDGVWEAVSVNELSPYPAAENIPVAQHHRRSMYGYVKRAAQHPAMQVFDMPTRTTTISRRRVSNTPLQALVMLNDPQFLESYEGLAAQALNFSEDQNEQINHIYRLALRREASSTEMNILLEQYERSLTRFSDDTEKAKDYLSVGLNTFDIDDAELAQFAALASVSRVVMNSPDAYIKH